MSRIDAPAPRETKQQQIDEYNLRIISAMELTIEEMRVAHHVAQRVALAASDCSAGGVRTGRIGLSRRDVVERAGLAMCLNAMRVVDRAEQ